MADLSNKALALLLLVAIVVSISGTIISLNRLESFDSLTGRATYSNQTGTTNFTITSSFSISFAVANANFGAGRVAGGGTCTMGTNGSVVALDSDCISFIDPQRNLTIENDGNVRANVSLNFSHNASSFIGGTSPSFMYRVVQNESGSCETILNGSVMTEVGTGGENTVAGRSICKNLNFTDSTDSISIAVWLRVPEDAPVRANIATLTAIGCDDSSC